jgi:hypothetical protein
VLKALEEILEAWERATLYGGADEGELLEL